MILKKYKLLIKKYRFLSFMASFCLLTWVHAEYNSGMSGTIKIEIVRGNSFGGTIVTGTARVVKTLADCDNVRSGDIVIAVMTKDEWNSSLLRCAGIVVDNGGDACHAVLYGKNHGIPVLLGAGNATKKIHSGDVILLDCSRPLYGAVYLATHDDLPTKFKPVHQAKIPLADTYERPSESKKLSQYVYYPEYYHYSSDAELQVKDKKYLYITQELFNKHHKQFIRYVLDMQDQLNDGRWWGEAIMFAGARKLKGCDDFAIECIPLSYNFFDQSKHYIESILTFIDLEFVNNLFEKYNAKPNNVSEMNWLARISHEEHVRTVPLPLGVIKEELIENPREYKKFIDQKIVEPKECHARIAAGLFVRYWVEKKCVA